MPIRSFRGQIFPGFPMALRRVCGSSPHESMAAEHKARRGQPGLPAVLRPDRRRVVEQTVFFLLLRQPGELGVERMIACEKRFLPMQDRWILGGRDLVQAVDCGGFEARSKSG